MSWQDKDIICYCQDISYRVIRRALEQGATTVEDLIEATDAGIACGTCIEDLEHIILEHNRAIERKR